ncbi:type I secretion system permease/ATPase [Rhizobium sp. RM]|uniref:type I secretion system permease/ATPase n=1 Tax=Rhizobium sp. RM TaxID=2748079 RepID=UPI00110EF659|nr:type I secretion system permease/ATPase [Rhizobium sp. RM]TMV22173.1 type I secretion system permease/ATPase [Rhizobium sp. Td3]
MQSKLTSDTYRKTVLQPLRRSVFSIGATSAVINLLAFTGPIFMLQVYDRILPGRSVPSLIGLAIIAAALFLFQGVLELLRSLLLARIGVSIDQRLNRGVLGALVSTPANGSSTGDGLQPVRDLDQVRNFLSGPGPTALFDLPWMPVYIAVCFLFHVWIGVAALCGAAILVIFAVLAEILSQRPAKAAAQFSTQRHAFAADARQNREAVMAMGFASRLANRWAAASDRYFASQIKTANIVSLLTTSSRIARMMLQSGVLAVGAFLVIREEATGGIIIASSILVSRALAPVELSIGQWRSFAAARQSWSRLAALLAATPQMDRAVKLPAPKATLTVENLSLAAPGRRDLLLRNVSFELAAGAVLGVVGPSASGKTSLARALIGFWPSAAEAIKFDKASLAQWEPAERGRHIGYLPQDVQLLDGSIADNISRFDTDAPSQSIIAAAEAAGIRQMIAELPDGFETRIGEGGVILSAGQRQRVALARALYGDPFLVVLDEPNSNLDAEGEAALLRALETVRERGGIAVVVAHRPNVLSVADHILALGQGRVQAFGPKETVLAQPAKAPVPGPLAFRVTYGKDMAS